MSIREQQEIIKLVMKNMNWDAAKATLWYVTANPFLGNVSPSTLVSMGRGHKVLAFIHGTHEENQLPTVNEGER